MNNPEFAVSELSRAPPRAEAGLCDPLLAEQLEKRGKGLPHSRCGRGSAVRATTSSLLRMEIMFWS